MADFSSTDWIKTARDRLCPECHTTIQAGATYVRFAGTYDGDFFSGFTCAPCHEFKGLYLEALDAHDLEPVYFMGNVIDGAGEFLDCQGGAGWVGKTWSERRTWAHALLINALTAGRARTRRRRDLSRAFKMIRALAPHGRTGGAPILRSPTEKNERTSHDAH